MSAPVLSLDRLEIYHFAAKRLLDDKAHQLGKLVVQKKGLNLFCLLLIGSRCSWLPSDTV